MNYFKQIDLKIKDLDVSRLRDDRQQYGFKEDFRAWYIRDMDYLKEKTRHIHFTIPPNSVGFLEVGPVGAHSDPWPATVSLNFYIQGGNRTTYFYEPKDPNNYLELPDTQGGVYTEMSAAKVYNDRDNLIVVDQFTAADETAYFLNVSKIHDVSKDNLTQPRLAIRWLWYELAFEEIVNSVKILD